jgi:Uma2 family endonuclease
MNISAISNKQYTVDEYIEFEENSEIRHEFHEGILYPVEATSANHNEVIQNVVAAFRPEFRKRGCKIFHENIKLQIIEKGKYVYPDIILTCDEDDKKSTFIMRYPSLIVEVLSKSTAPYDRSSKFNFYQTIPSIQYYLLIESRWQSVELYSRTEKEGVWTYQRFSKPTDIIEFPKLDFQLLVEDIYEGISIPERLSFIIDEKDEN